MSERSISGIGPCRNGKWAEGGSGVAKRHLKVVREAEPGRCGAPTSSGDPCRNPAGENGRCWLSSHQPAPDEEEGGPELREIPAPPEHLGEEGRHCWDVHVAQIVDLGVLEQIDLTVLEKMAELYEAGRRAWKAVQKLGVVVPGRGKSVKTNPACAKHVAYATEYRQYVKEVGRLLASAAKTKDVDDDPLAGLLEL